jgi:hypothetical protein
VFQNTIITIIIVAGFGASLPFMIIPTWNLLHSIWFWLFAFSFAICLLVIYKTLSHEKIIYGEGLGKIVNISDWKNNELRPLGSATILNGALFLQFFDIPFTLNKQLGFKYAFEFKAKVLTDVIAWTISGPLSQTSMKAYMFQYSPQNKTLRPHFLVGYDNNTNQTIWITPEMSASPLRKIENLELKEKNRWLYIRTEVRMMEIEKRFDAKLPTTLKINVDGTLKEFEYNPAYINKLIDIRMFDMNNYGKEMFQAVYTEPPYKYLGCDHVGFRNWGYESALYKDIKVFELSKEDT